MSTLMSQARTRVPRIAEAATIRARLSLVPARHTTAKRTPFVVLIGAILAIGVVGLLMFNTHMQQGAFTVTDLQQKADALAAKKQGLDMELADLRDPQALAIRGRNLGMVSPEDPAFVRLSDGKVLGTPSPAVAGPDGVRVKGYPAALPADLARPPRVVKVQAITPKTTTKSTTTTAKKSSTTSSSQTSAAGSGAASTDTPKARDRKKTH